jgi:hypothetical protein
MCWRTRRKLNNEGRLKPIGRINLLRGPLMIQGRLSADEERDPIILPCALFLIRILARMTKNGFYSCSERLLGMAPGPQQRQLRPNLSGWEKWGRGDSVPFSEPKLFENVPNRFACWHSAPSTLQRGSLRADSRQFKSFVNASCATTRP